MAVFCAADGGGVVFTVSKKTAKAVNAVSFDAVVHEVKTLSDGGLRFTFDVPEGCVPQAAWLMECKRNETALRLAVAVNDEG
jgi:hypothetical protein